MDNKDLQVEFSKLIAKTKERKNQDLIPSISLSEHAKLLELAVKIGGKFKFFREGNELRSCYWICNNGFMCDPEDIDPSCINCHEICMLVQPE